MDEEKSFLGTGWDFPPTFNKNSASVEMISNEEDIKSSLKILLSTRIGERIMQPTYGCEMTKLLFEPIDTTLKTYIKDLINDAILYHEPRIILNDLDIINANLESGLVEVIIDYTIISTNTRNNYVYPFYKSEGTNITK
jgi:phage baseplate assembly protein W